MDRRIEVFLKSLGKEGAALVKDEVQTFFQESVADGDDFTKQLKLDIEQYTLQLALSDITKSDYEMYLRSQARQMRSHLIGIEVSKRATAQRVLDGLQDLLLAKLIPLL